MSLDSYSAIRFYIINVKKDFMEVIIYNHLVQSW